MFSFRTLILGIPIAALTAIVVACGPGNNGPVAGVVTVPQSSVATIAPFSSSGSSALAASLGVPIALPNGGGVSGTLTVPAGSTVPAGTILSGSVGSTLPSGAPTLSSLYRQSASGARTAQGETSSVTGILYGTFSLSNAITINGTTGLTFNFPAGYVGSIPSSFSVYIAFFDPTRPTLGWLDRVINCTTNASSNSITCTFTGTANIPPNVTYVWALYAVATSSTAPTPAPSVSVVPATPNPNQVTVAPTGAPTTIALPAEGGISATLAVPAALAGPGTTITGYAGTTTSGVFLPPLTGSGVNSILYVGSFTPSAQTQYSTVGTTTVTFTVKSPATISPTANYYLATYDSTTSSGWFLKVLGPGVVNATAGTITFTAGGFQFKANCPYGFALYL